MEYTWIISALDCKVSENGLTNVVSTIHWRYRGTDEDEISYETYGAQPMSAPDPTSFVPYEDVTEVMVIDWLENTLEVETLQSQINSQIDLIKNPVIVTLPLYK